MSTTEGSEPCAGSPGPTPPILIEDDAEPPLPSVLSSSSIPAPSSSSSSTGEATESIPSATTEPTAPRKGVGENQAAVSGILSACRSAAAAAASRKRPAPSTRPGDTGAERARPIPTPPAEPPTAKAKRRTRGTTRDHADTTTETDESNDAVSASSSSSSSSSSRPSTHATGDRSDEESRGEKRRRVSPRQVAATKPGEREPGVEGEKGNPGKEAEAEEEGEEGSGTDGKEATAVVTMKVMMPPHDPEDVDASIACAFEAVFAGVRSLLEETQLVHRINARNEEHRRSIEAIDRLIAGIPPHGTDPSLAEPSPASSPSHASSSAPDEPSAADDVAPEEGFRDKISRYQRMREELERLGRTMLNEAQRERAGHKKTASLHSRRVRSLRALDLLCAVSSDGTKEDRRCIVCMENLGRGEVVLLRCAHALCLSCRIRLAAEWEWTAESEAPRPFSRCPHCFSVVEYAGPPAAPPRRRPSASPSISTSTPNPEAPRRHSGAHNPPTGQGTARAPVHRIRFRDPPPNPSSGIVLLQGPPPHAPPSSSSSSTPSDHVAVASYSSSSSSHEGVASGARSRSATPTLLPSMPASVSSALPSPASALPNATPDFSLEDYFWDDAEDPLLP